METKKYRVRFNGRIFTVNGRSIRVVRGCSGEWRTVGRIYDGNYIKIDIDPKTYSYTSIQTQTEVKLYNRIAKEDLIHFPTMLQSGKVTVNNKCVTYAIYKGYKFLGLKHASYSMPSTINNLTRKYRIYDVGNYSYSDSSGETNWNVVLENGIKKAIIYDFGLAYL